MFYTALKLLTVCSYHVTYAFQSEPTFYSCLNVKELLAQNRCEMWSVSGCSWTRTHNHLVRKWTLNQAIALTKVTIFDFLLIFAKKMLTLAKLKKHWYWKAYFLWLHICVNLRTKFQVSSIDRGGNFTIPHLKSSLLKAYPD